MRIKEEMDLGEFIKDVKGCAADVWFRTEEGDNLNLKSTLSQYLLAALAGNQKMLHQGRILCDNAEDYVLLRKYLKEN